MTILLTVLACAASKPSSTAHSGTDAHTATGGSGGGGHSAAVHSGYGCGGLFSFPGTTIDPDTPGVYEVCLTTRSLAERCASSSWDAPFGGCPDLATLRAAIEVGTVDPIGADLREATTTECSGPDGTWTALRFQRRATYYDAEEYGAWFDPAGALVALVEDWGSSYDGEICCSGTSVTTLWYGVVPPGGLTCAPGAPIVGPVVDSGGSGR